MEKDSEPTGVRTVGATEAYQWVMDRHHSGERVVPRRKLDGLEQYLIYRMKGSLRTTSWIERIVVEYLEDSCDE